MSIRVEVRANIEKAIKVLRRKMDSEGVRSVEFDVEKGPEGPRAMNIRVTGA